MKHSGKNIFVFPLLVALLLVLGVTLYKVKDTGSSHDIRGRAANSKNAVTMGSNESISGGNRKLITFHTEKQSPSALDIWIDEVSSPVSTRSDVALGMRIAKNSQNTYMLSGYAMKEGGNLNNTQDHNYTGEFIQHQSQDMYFNSNKQITTTQTPYSTAVVHLTNSSWGSDATGFSVSLDIELLPRYFTYQWLNIPWYANGKPYRELFILSQSGESIPTGNTSSGDWRVVGSWLAYDSNYHEANKITALSKNNGTSSFSTSTSNTLDVSLRIPRATSVATVWLDELYPSINRTDVALRIRLTKAGSTYTASILNFTSSDPNQAYESSAYTWTPIGTIGSNIKVFFTLRGSSLYALTQTNDSFGYVDLSKSSVQADSNDDRIILSFGILPLAGMRYLRAFTNLGDQAVLPGNFSPPSDILSVGNKPSFDQLHIADDKTRFLTEKNIPYMVVGVNHMAPQRTMSKTEMRGLFTKYRMHGINTVRVFLDLNYVTGENHTMNRPILATDELFATAQETGIRLIVALSDTDYVFRKPEAYDAMVTYILDRWGNNPSILMWDITNDIQVSVPQDQARTRMQQVHDFIKSKDSFHRPVGVQLHTWESLLGTFPYLYGTVDYATVRFYGNESQQNCTGMFAPLGTSNGNDTSGITAKLAAEYARMAQSGKVYPLMVGEIRSNGASLQIGKLPFSSKLYADCMIQARDASYAFPIVAFMPWLGNYPVQDKPYPQYSEYELDRAAVDIRKGLVVTIANSLSEQGNTQMNVSAANGYYIKLNVPYTGFLEIADGNRPGFYRKWDWFPSYSFTNGTVFVQPSTLSNALGKNDKRKFRIWLPGEQFDSIPWSNEWAVTITK